MCAVDSGSVKPRQSHKTVSCTCCFFHIAKNCFLITMKHDVAWRGESSNKWFFMLINYLCISYVLFVDIFTWSFDHFIWMKFLFAVFLPTSPFITLEIFAKLPVYCTLHVYYFGRNLPASLFIPLSPSIWNSTVIAKDDFLNSSLFCISFSILAKSKSVQVTNFQGQQQNYI